MKWREYDNGDMVLMCDVVEISDSICMCKKPLAEIHFEDGIWYIEYQTELYNFETDAFTGITMEKVIKIAEKRVRDALYRISSLWQKAAILSGVVESEY